MFGKIESLKISDSDTKKELYKANLLAFETLALKNELSLLDSVESKKDFELLVGIFKTIDELERVLFYNIDLHPILWT
jgi:hypothetical protein